MCLGSRAVQICLFERGVKHSEVFRQLQETFNCYNPGEYFELLQEPERKPNFKRLASRNENNSSVGSEPSTPDASVEAVRGGSVLHLVFSNHVSNQMLAPGRKKIIETMGLGTLTVLLQRRTTQRLLPASV